jgi:thymidylate kinase
MPTPRHRRRGLLVAVEGLDAAGTSATADLLARWLERIGRRVHVVPWEASSALQRAAADPRRRQALTARVAALLVAAEAVRRIDARLRGPLGVGEVVVADRYAWTPVAREIARGLDPDWVARLYGQVPRPDVVLFARTDPVAALTRALRVGANAARAEAVRPAFGEFLRELSTAYEGIATGALPGPWPARTTIVDAGLPPEIVTREAREAVRSMLDDPRRAIA